MWTPSLNRLCHSKLFNLSLDGGQFPFLWKMADTIAIYNKGDPADVRSYRPVSIISCPGKIFEKVFFINASHF